ncbi:MAG: Extracellular ligand-binding receptor [Pseudonocardiales bacterium]|nr:Extracellular ligand-binding receptor [Pseudonocardiales bacterium]
MGQRLAIPHLSTSGGRGIVVAAATVAAVALAACSSGSAAGNSAEETGRSSGSASSARVDPATGKVNPSACHNTTAGVTSDTITFGLSHPESGPSAVTGQIADGVRAYFDYANAELGGVKNHKFKLVTMDDAAQPARTVANVNAMLAKDAVFGFVSNLGTPNNLAIRDQLEKQCVPNLLISTGSAALVDPVDHPFTVIANATYATEAYAFVDYVAKNNPGASIASITEDSDFGKSYREPLLAAAKAKNLTVVSQQTYEPTDTNVAAQFTAIRATKATALFIGAAGLKCAQSIDAGAGQFAATYLSANCTSVSILKLAKPANSNGLLSETALLDPNLPANADNDRVKTYFAKVKQYAPSADPKSSLISYGWTEAAILREILQRSPALDRVSVINTAHNLDLSDTPGLLQNGVHWKTAGIEDPYPIESFRLQRWDSSTSLFVPFSDVTSYEGRSAGLAS